MDGWVNAYSRLVKVRDCRKPNHVKLHGVFREMNEAETPRWMILRLVPRNTNVLHMRRYLSTLVQDQVLP